MKSIHGLVKRYGIEIAVSETVQAVDPFRRGYTAKQVTLRRGRRRASFVVFLRHEGDMTATRAIRLAVRDLLQAESTIRDVHMVDDERRRHVRQYVTATEDALLSLIGEARLRRLKETYSNIKNELEAIYDDYNLDGYEINV